MKIIATSLRQLVHDFADNHRQLAKEITTVKLDETKWTLKEIIGHLIDSASNNHQRITRLQLIEELHFPSYELEELLKDYLKHFKDHLEYFETRLKEIHENN